MSLDGAAARDGGSPGGDDNPIGPSPPADASSRSTKRQGLVIGLLLLALIAWLFAPTLVWLIHSWRVDDDYGHGPVLVVAALFLAWRRWSARSRPVFERGRPRAALGLLGLAALGQLAALRLGSMPLAAASLVAALVGWSALVGGATGLATAAYPALLLFLAIPLPIVDPWGTPLAARVAAVTARAAQLLGSPALVRGGELAVGQERFTVGAPCSGLRSLVAAVGLAAVLAGILSLSPGRRLLLVAAALPLAILGNGLRLLLLILAAERLGTDAALSLFHGPLGAGGFLVLALLLVLLALRWERREHGSLDAGHV